MSTDIQPVRIFIAYSHKDLVFKDEIRRRLKPLLRAGKVCIWDNYNIEGGGDWDADIREKLAQADIILLLLSPDALDSDYFYEVEAPIALQRHQAGEAIAVGIKLRPCTLKHTPFENLERYELLPKKGYPVTDPHWHHVDAAYLTISEEIDILVEKVEGLRSKKTERDPARFLQNDKNDDPFADLMIPIKGGTFIMGDIFRDGNKMEKPLHHVAIQDFHLCKYPVTQAQWKAIMGDNPSLFRSDENLPVERISWNNAQAFIKKLNEKTRKKYRLPSEAEWEYAAREGGRKIRFGNGKDGADPKEMNFNAENGTKRDYSEIGEYRQKTTIVNAFAPNVLGLHDMSGNVYEFCQDTWHNDYRGASNDGSAWEYGGLGSLRVVRGGSWYDDPYRCRAAFRNHDSDSFGNYLVGFRLAR